MLLCCTASLSLQNLKLVKQQNSISYYDLLRSDVCCCDGIKSYFKMVNSGQSYIESLLIVVICGTIGGIVYLLFVLTSGLASHILGDRIQRLPVLGKLVK